MKGLQEKILVDSAALLDWFNDMPSAEIVERNLERAAVSAITLSIVASKIGAKVEPHESTRLLNLGFEVFDVDEQVALEIARVSYATISHDLAIEDLVLLATGRVHQIDVISGSDALIGVKLDEPSVITLRKARRSVKSRRQPSD